MRDLVLTLLVVPSELPSPATPATPSPPSVLPGWNPDRFSLLQGRQYSTCWNRSCRDPGESAHCSQHPHGPQFRHLLKVTYGYHQCEGVIMTKTEGRCPGGAPAFGGSQTPSSQGWSSRGGRDLRIGGQTLPSPIKEQVDSAGPVLTELIQILRTFAASRRFPSRRFAPL